MRYIECISTYWRKPQTQKGTPFPPSHDFALTCVLSRTYEEKLVTEAFPLNLILRSNICDEGRGTQVGDSF